MAHVLIVEDEAALAAALGLAVRRMGHTATTAASAAAGLARHAERPPDLVVLDLGLPDRSGIQVLGELRQVAPELPVLVITAHGDLQNAVAAKKAGTSAYLVKPLDLAEFEQTVRGLLAQGIPSGQHSAPPAADHTPLLVGSAPAMQPAFAAIAHACASDAPVLITGPTGIGKSLCAQLIHRNSNRHQGPFAVVSCASLPEALLEAELFGHERGSFTGATEGRPGHLEMAAGGTLLLDEVGEIPLPLQVKLLRFVEERTFHRVGGREERHVDVRVLAATNRNLATAVAERTFREDLFYRLRVLEVQFPPLRDRRSDLPALSSYLLAGIARDRRLQIAEAAQQLLVAYDWPGNVRELRNVLEHAAATCSGTVIQPLHLPQHLRRRAGATPVVASPALHAEWLEQQLREGLGYDQILTRVEEHLLRLLLPRFQGKPTLMARAMGMHRATLRKKLRALPDWQPIADEPEAPEGDDRDAPPHGRV